jgi:hypothetical protein
LEFGNVRECLDIYHALEHLRKLGQLLYGNGTPAYKEWYKSAKKDLMSGGFELIDKCLACLKEKKLANDACELLCRLRNYFENHSERWCDRERLSEGRAIGSGQVEGACKSMIGKRLKQTGARWKVRNLNRMLIVCALRYGTAWNDYWKAATYPHTKRGRTPFCLLLAFFFRKCYHAAQIHHSNKIQENTLCTALLLHR